MIVFPKQSECITITSALPYVNGVKHLGNITGSLLPADIFHRWCDLLGIPNIFICGTDDHGAAVELAAAAEGVDPKDYADRYHKIQKEIYSKWHFDFTVFGRTSSKANHDLTKAMFKAMHKNGFIKPGELLLPYCAHCGRYLEDRYVQGTCPNCGYEKATGDQCEHCAKLLDPVELKVPRCALCGLAQIEFKTEKHLFLDLSALAPAIESWINKAKGWPSSVSGTALGWIKEGLKPRCITRNLKWGIKVPLKGYTHLVFYVWFDAPIGYISITKARKDWKKWWTGNAKIYHFVGKDNIPFHAILWPGMLMAAKNGNTGFNLPHYIAGYEFLNWEGQKFSTSRRVGLFSDTALDLFPVDYWRYYLSSILPEGKDSNFEWEDFQAKINNELIANYGNLFYRVSSFIEKYFGKVPRVGKGGKPEEELKAKFATGMDRIEKTVKKVHLRDALKEVMALSDALNAYFQAKEPWFAIKTNKKDAATTLVYAINYLNIVTQLLLPYIPASTNQALKALNVKKLKFDQLKASLDPKQFVIKPGHKIRSMVLFEKIEDEELEEVKKTLLTQEIKKPLGVL